MVYIDQHTKSFHLLRANAFLLFLALQKTLIEPLSSISAMEQPMQPSCTSAAPFVISMHHLFLTTQIILHKAVVMHLPSPYHLKHFAHSSPHMLIKITCHKSF